MKLLKKYAEHGAAQIVLPEVLKVLPVSDHGQTGDIAKLFGGADQLRDAMNRLQTLLYAT
jgi:type I restriction enzyme, R subunit